MITQSDNGYHPNVSTNEVVRNCFEKVHDNICVILSGSVKDEKHVTKLGNELKKANI